VFWLVLPDSICSRAEDSAMACASAFVPAGRGGGAKSSGGSAGAMPDLAAGLDCGAGKGVCAGWEAAAAEAGKAVGVVQSGGKGGLTTGCKSDSAETAANADAAASLASELSRSNGARGSWAGVLNAGAEPGLLGG
jgi:hypothetical protein